MLVVLQGVVGPIPWSGYLLCFIPLAAIIFGFIAAAALTDRHARRTYLRYMPADSAPEYVPNERLPEGPHPSD